MKNFKLLFIGFMLLATSTMYSQSNYGPIEWDIIGLGFAVPGDDGISGGLTLRTEPRYNLNDQVSISLRFQLAVLGSAVDTSSVDIDALTNLSVFGDYYFNNNENKRAFAGLGIGTFSGAGLEVDSNTSIPTEVDTNRSLGVTPRVGFELGILRITTDYSYTFSSNVPNYLGLNLGLTIGGRYRGS